LLKSARSLVVSFQIVAVKSCVATITHHRHCESHMPRQMNVDARIEHISHEQESLYRSLVALGSDKCISRRLLRPIQLFSRKPRFSSVSHPTPTVETQLCPAIQCIKMTLAYYHCWDSVCLVIHMLQPLSNSMETMMTFCHRHCPQHCLQPQRH
jgi:hypothetical protein